MSLGAVTSCTGVQAPSATSESRLLLMHMPEGISASCMGWVSAIHTEHRVSVLLLKPNPAPIVEGAGRVSHHSHSRSTSALQINQRIKF